MMTNERLAELHDNFWAETNDEETQEWRDDLTTEETALVDQWDGDFNQAMLNICEKILANEARRNAQ